MRLMTLAVVGRLLVWTIQTNGLTKPLFDRHPKLTELRECDFCLGFWVFTPLAYAMGVNLMEPLYIPILSEILTGLIVSFAVHIARIGWTAKFGVENLGEW